MNKHKKPIKESAEFMRTLDGLVNNSIESHNEFLALIKFNEALEIKNKYSNTKVINYCLDKYNEGFSKHESLMGTYILMGSGVDMADRFFYYDMINPYIDGEYLDNTFDD